MQVAGRQHRQAGATAALPCLGWLFRCLGVPASQNPVKDGMFLEIDYLKTQMMKTKLIENRLSRLLGADKQCRHVAASFLRLRSIGGRYGIAGKSRDVKARKGPVSCIISING